MSNAQRFFDLFQGLDRSHGTYVVPEGTQPDSAGKLKGDAITITAEKFPAEAALWKEHPVQVWEKHLTGEKSLGVVPIQADNTCVWGCLDIDSYQDFDIAVLLEKARNELNLDLVICRSKSGGAHCFLFAAEPVTAILMRARLAECRDALGLDPKTEIFPKQETLTEANGSGGWLNMPYFGPDYGGRYSVMPYGVCQSPEEFLSYVEDGGKQPASWFTKPVAFMQAAGTAKKKQKQTKPEPEYKAGLEDAHYPQLLSMLAAWIGENGPPKKLSNGEIDLRVFDMVDAADVTDPAKRKEYIRELRRFGYKKRDEDQTKEPRTGKNSISSLLNLCQDFEYFHTGAMSKPYIRLLNKNHHEVHTLESVKGVLRLRYLEKTGGQGQPKREDLTSTMDLFGARCSAGESREISVRVAQTPDAIYIDLGDDTWRAIEIKATGWRIVDDPPVLFQRGAGALPLPIPVGGGDLKKLCEIVNVSEDQFVLAAGWLLGRLNPIAGAAMPHLVLQGGPGSTKTTGASILIRTLDPSLTPLTSMPANEQDAMLAAQDCGVFGLDNISGFRYSMSDLLCCLSTGASRKIRTLYETSGLTVEAVRRPVLINGIDAGFLRGDLADRSTVLSLPKVTIRRTDGEVESAFVGMHAELLGAICDAAVTGLRKLPDTNLVNPPRMAAYCTWISACEESLPWAQGEFLTLYRAYHRETNRTLLENDQVGSAIVEWGKENLAEGSFQEMTMSEWLRELTVLVYRPGHVRIDPKHWPGGPGRLAAYLPRIADLLREEGLVMEALGRKHGGIKPWRLSLGPQQIEADKPSLERSGLDAARDQLQQIQKEPERDAEKEAAAEKADREWMAEAELKAA